MDKHYYNAASLERALASFEDRYGMSSEEFFEAHRADTLETLPGFHRAAWASMYRELRALRGVDFADQVERVLA